MAEHNGGKQQEAQAKQQRGGAQTRFSNQDANEDVERVSHMAREGVDEISARARDLYGHARQSVVSNPGTSMLVAFGLGAGVGLVLASLLTEDTDDRHQMERMFDKFSCTVSDAISRVIPDRLADRWRS